MISGIEMRQNVVLEIAIAKVAPRAGERERQRDHAGNQRGRNKKGRGTAREMRP